MTPNWIFLCMMFCAFKACSSVNLNCTFENGFCGWQNKNTSKLMWHVWNSTSPLGRTALPFSDHSLKNSSGHFAFIRGTEARNTSWTASLISVPITMTSKGKMTFWYYMSGHGVGMLHVYLVQSNGNSVTVLQLNGRQGRQWKQAEMLLVKGQFQIVIEATARRHYDSDLAIDDIVVIEDFNGLATTIEPSTTPKYIRLPLTCNFDSDLCGFTIPPSAYSQVNWQRKKQPAIENGKVYIKGDNTTGNGYYMSLLEYAAGGMAGDKSEMLSPVISTVSPSCLTMAYILPSSQSGTISIYQISIYNRTWDLLREISGYRGQGWKSVQVDIPISPLFQIVIEGLYAGAKGSFVGVDDLKIEHGNCIKPTMPTFKSSLLSSCNFSSQTEIASLSCTFENDLCEYQTDAEGLKWKQMEGPLGGFFSRLTSDHTSQNDPKAKHSYAILDIDDFSAPFNSGGDLTSIALNDTVCIEFWYQIIGFGGNLDVMIESNNGLRKSIWKSSSLNRRWTMVALRVESMSTFRIVFHSVKLKSAGYVAVDDISGYNILPETTTESITTRKSATSKMHSSSTTTGKDTNHTVKTTPSGKFTESAIKTVTTVTSAALKLNSTAGKNTHNTSEPTTPEKLMKSSTEVLTTKSGMNSSVVVKSTVSEKLIPTISTTLEANTKKDNSNKDTSEDKTTTVIISVVVSIVALTIILVVVYRVNKRHFSFKENFSSGVELKNVTKYISMNSTNNMSFKQDNVSNTKFIRNVSNGHIRSVT